MTPTQEQLQAMTDDQLNALAAEALGMETRYIGGVFNRTCWCKDEMFYREVSWSPATNIADAMGLPMDGVTYTVYYFNNGIIEIAEVNPEIKDAFVSGMRSHEARARTIFFLLTRSKP